MVFDTSLFGGIATALARAWRQGGRLSRIGIGIAFGAGVIGAIFSAAADSELIPRQDRNVSWVYFLYSSDSNRRCGSTLREREEGVGKAGNY